MKALKSIFILFIIASLFSCKTYDRDESFPDGGNVKFVNLATNSYPTPYEIRKDDVPFVTTNFGSFSRYYRMATGNHTFDFYSVLGDTKTKVMSFSEGVSLNQSVTYFISNNGTTNELTYIKAMDDVTPPEIGKAKVRFINMANNIGANVDVVGGSTPLFSNVENAKVTDFITVDSGNLLIKIYKTGVTTGTPLKTLTVALKSTGITTIAFIGVNGNTATQPPLTIISDSNTQ